MSGEIVPLRIPRGLAAIAAKPPALFLPFGKGAERFFDFFTNQSSPRTTKLYDRRNDELTLDEYERVGL